MHVFLRRRSGQKHTYDNQIGSLIAVSMLTVALIFFGAARDSLAGDGDSVEVAADPSAAPTLTPDSSSPDSNWEEANQVLEIPQACSQDGVAVACDKRADASFNDSSSSGDDDDEEDIETVGPVRTAPTLDGDATSGDSAVAMQQYGGVDDYQNELAEAPIMMPPTGWSVASSYPSAYPMNPNSRPRMALMAARSPWHWGPMPMSSPLTPAARPPLNPGPWMSSPAMTWGRPAGSLMVMPNMPFRMH